VHPLKTRSGATPKAGGEPPLDGHPPVELELDDDDVTFSGSPHDLEAMLRDGAIAPPSPQRRWPPSVALAIAILVSLGLWAAVLLLLR
jgi:hypothetical protein